MHYVYLLFVDIHSGTNFLRYKKGLHINLLETGKATWSVNLIHVPNKRHFMGSKSCLGQFHGRGYQNLQKNFALLLAS